MLTSLKLMWLRIGGLGLSQFEILVFVLVSLLGWLAKLKIWERNMR